MNLFAYADQLMETESQGVPTSYVPTRKENEHVSNFTTEVGFGRGLTEKSNRRARSSHGRVSTGETSESIVSPNSKSAPTLFLLDDCLTKMETARQRNKQLREDRKKRNATNFYDDRTAFLVNAGVSGGGGGGECCRCYWEQ